MASLYILYIDDDIVGRCLELIRRVCEPASTSKPHVTVRGPLRRTDKTGSLWKDEQFNEIELVEPGLFDSSAKSVMPQNTVFIRCDLHNPKLAQYKPDYITSPPHITLYDGHSKEFANRLVVELEKFDWHLKVPLASRPKLTKVILRKRRNVSDTIVHEYSISLQNLFTEITKEKLDYSYLRNLNINQRVQLVTTIYKYLEKLVVTNRGRNHMTQDKLRIRQEHTMEVWKDLHKTYRGDQEELDLLRNSHDEATALNPRVLRSKLGQFLTPPELAIEITRFAGTLLPRSQLIHFGDPSIGSGTFYSALRQVFPKQLIGSAIGIEIDKTIVSITKRLWAKHGLRLIEGDFFQQRLNNPRNLILCNPPYVRHHFLLKKQKGYLRTRVQKELDIPISGRSSLYAYFMLICHGWMTDGAIAAWLIPSEFMESNYGMAIRRYLTEFVSVVRIHRFDPKDIQFEGVVVASSIVVFKKGKPREDHVVQFSYGGSLSSPKEKIEILSSQLQSRDKWPSSAAAVLPKKTSHFRLKELFTVRRGIATGANSFFILPRTRARDLGIPNSYLRPILPGPRDLSEQIVHSESDGYPKLALQLSLIDCDLPESELRKRHPRFWDYLKTARSNGITSRYLVRNREPWYRQERREPPPFLCTYFGRDAATGSPFRFVWNQSEAVATNLYLFLYPTRELAEALKRNPRLHKRVFDLLNGIQIAQLNDGGRVYGGGLHKLEPRDLAELAIPQFEDLLDVPKRPIRKPHEYWKKVENE